MSHLPECPAPCCEWRPQPCDCQCLCDLLRAVEERVEESMDRVWTNALRIKQAEAYANGVQAARDAVARTCGHTKYEGCRPCAHDDVLATIDALLERTHITNITAGGEQP